MKQAKIKKIIIEQLRKIPIAQIACEKSNVSRATYYRWRKEDKEFEKLSDEAMIEGESLISDMSEHQVISLIRDRNFPAIQLWLKNHHSKYSDKVEISGNLKLEDEALTLEQQELIEQALKLSGLVNNKEIHQNDNS